MDADHQEGGRLRGLTRRALVAGCGAACLAHAVAGRGQPRPARKHLIGFLGAESEQSVRGDLDLLRKGLAELGHPDGTHVAYEVRYADGNYARLKALAGELAAGGVDVLVTSGSKAGFAAKEATATVPVVVSNMGDAQLAGFAGSLARPGSNVTGISMLNPEVTAKQLALLREVKPKLAHVGVLMNPANPNYALTLAALRQAGEAARLRVEPFNAQRPAEIAAAIRNAANAGCDGLIVQSETLFVAHATQLVEAAVKHRIATAGVTPLARAGTLLGYSANSRERWRQVAAYVDRILRGAKPAELPIAQPSRFELVVNLRTAQAIGISVPEALLARADEVIR